MSHTIAPLPSLSKGPSARGGGRRHGKCATASHHLYASGLHPRNHLNEFGAARPHQFSARPDRSEIVAEACAYAVVEERNRLGREMHDRVGQALASASAFSSAATELLRTGNLEETTWALDHASKALKQACSDLRESICALRTVDVAPEAWVASLHTYLDLYEQQWGIHCQLQIDSAAATACGAEGRVALTWILQEALTNVRRHAHTNRAAISVWLEDGSITAEVVDHGRGFDAGARPCGHYGLGTMQERASALGGDLSITSGANGTRLRVRLPARRH